jgi:hypothetical protein
VGTFSHGRYVFRPLERRPATEEISTDGDGEVHKGDNNAKAYIEKFGLWGGEVEALGIERMQQLVRDFVEETYNAKLWKQTLKLEVADKKKLATLEL